MQAQQQSPLCIDQRQQPTSCTAASSHETGLYIQSSTQAVPHLAPPGTHTHSYRVHSACANSHAKDSPLKTACTRMRLLPHAGDRAALTAAVPQQPTPTPVPPARLRFFKCAQTPCKPPAPPCFGGASQPCSLLHLHTHPPGSQQHTCWFTQEHSLAAPPDMPGDATASKAARLPSAALLPRGPALRALHQASRQHSMCSRGTCRLAVQVVVIVSCSRAGKASSGGRCAGTGSSGLGVWEPAEVQGGAGSG